MGGMGAQGSWGVHPPPGDIWESHRWELMEGVQRQVWSRAYQLGGKGQQNLLSLFLNRLSAASSFTSSKPSEQKQGSQFSDPILSEDEIEL